MWNEDDVNELLGDGGDVGGDDGDFLHEDDFLFLDVGAGVSGGGGGGGGVSADLSVFGGPAASESFRLRQRFHLHVKPCDGPSVQFAHVLAVGHEMVVAATVTGALVAWTRRQQHQQPPPLPQQQPHRHGPTPPTVSARSIDDGSSNRCSEVAADGWSVVWTSEGHSAGGPSGRVVALLADADGRSAAPPSVLSVAADGSIGRWSLSDGSCQRFLPAAADGGDVPTLAAALLGLPADPFAAAAAVASGSNNDTRPPLSTAAAAVQNGNPPPPKTASLSPPLLVVSRADGQLALFNGVSLASWPSPRAAALRASGGSADSVDRLLAASRSGGVLVAADPSSAVLRLWHLQCAERPDGSIDPARKPVLVHAANIDCRTVVSGVGADDTVRSVAVAGAGDVAVAVVAVGDHLLHLQLTVGASRTDLSVRGRELVVPRPEPRAAAARVECAAGRLVVWWQHREQEEEQPPPSGDSYGCEPPPPTAASNGDDVSASVFEFPIDGAAGDDQAGTETTVTAAAIDQQPRADGDRRHQPLLLAGTRNHDAVVWEETTPGPGNANGNSGRSLAQLSVTGLWSPLAEAAFPEAAAAGVGAVTCATVLDDSALGLRLVVGNAVGQLAIVPVPLALTAGAVGPDAILRFQAHVGGVTALCLVQGLDRHNRPTPLLVSGGADAVIRVWSLTEFAAAASAATTASTAATTTTTTTKTKTTTTTTTITTENVAANNNGEELLVPPAAVFRGHAEAICALVPLPDADSLASGAPSGRRGGGGSPNRWGRSSPNYNYRRGSKVGSPPAAGHVRPRRSSSAASSAASMGRRDSLPVSSPADGGSSSPAASARTFTAAPPLGGTEWAGAPSSFASFSGVGTAHAQLFVCDAAAMLSSSSAGQCGFNAPSYSFALGDGTQLTGVYWQPRLASVLAVWRDRTASLWTAASGLSDGRVLDAEGAALARETALADGGPCIWQLPAVTAAAADAGQPLVATGGNQPTTALTVALSAPGWAWRLAPSPLGRGGQLLLLVADTEEVTEHQSRTATTSPTPTAATAPPALVNPCCCRSNKLSLLASSLCGYGGAEPYNDWQWIQEAVVQLTQVQQHRDPPQQKEFIEQLLDEAERRRLSAHGLLHQSTTAPLFALLAPLARLHWHAADGRPVASAAQRLFGAAVDRAAAREPAAVRTGLLEQWEATLMMARARPLNAGFDAARTASDSAGLAAALMILERPAAVASDAPIRRRLAEWLALQLLQPSAAAAEPAAGGSDAAMGPAVNNNTSAASTAAAVAAAASVASAAAPSTSSSLTQSSDAGRPVVAMADDFGPLVDDTGSTVAAGAAAQFAGAASADEVAERQWAEAACAAVHEASGGSVVDVRNAWRRAVLAETFVHALPALYPFLAESVEPIVTRIFCASMATGGSPADPRGDVVWARVMQRGGGGGALMTAATTDAASSAAAATPSISSNARKPLPGNAYDCARFQATSKLLRALLTLGAHSPKLLLSVINREIHEPHLHSSGNRAWNLASRGELLAQYQLEQRQMASTELFFGGGGSSLSTAAAGAASSSSSSSSSTGGVDGGQPPPAPPSSQAQPHHRFANRLRSTMGAAGGSASNSPARRRARLAQSTGNNGGGVLRDSSNEALLATVSARASSTGSLRRSQLTRSLAESGVVTQHDVGEPADHALRLATALVVQQGRALRPSLSWLTSTAVKALDPHFPAVRAGALAATESLLASLVDTFHAVSFHQTSQRLAVGAVTTIVVYDLKTAARAHALEGHQGAITDLAYSASGKHLASFSAADGSLRLWTATSSLFGMSGPTCKRQIAVQLPNAAPASTQAVVADGGLPAYRLQWVSDSRVMLFATSTGETLAMLDL